MADFSTGDNKYLNDRNIAGIYLILMSIQYIPIEGWGVSYVKFAAMCLSPFIWLYSCPVISKALIFGMLFFSLLLLSSLFNIESFRLSTIGYQFTFLCTYITFYTLIVYKKVFSLDDFIRLLKGLIYAYAIVLIIQQILILLGLKHFPLVNYIYFLGRGIGANSLALEPSHAARICGVAYFSLIRLLEVRHGRSLFLNDIKTDLKWVTISFLWCMITMGSGTAFVILGIISLYFLKKQYALTIVPLLVCFYFVIPFIENESLQRAYNVVQAFLTGDQSTITRVDNSASGRINPLLNTIDYLDLSDLRVWIGYGIDTKNTVEKPFIGCIQDYGLIAFIAMQILVYSCTIKRLISIESLLWIFIFGMAFQNFAYTWAVLMMWTGVKFFQVNSNEYEEDFN